MSFDIGVNENTWNDSFTCVANDGSVMDNERCSYSYYSLPPGGSPRVEKEQRGSFLSAIRHALNNNSLGDHNESTSRMTRNPIINGLMVSTLTVSDISCMCEETASDFLNQMHIEGYLLKKGFRGLRLWKRRYFILQGSVLLYYDVLSL